MPDIFISYSIQDEKLARFVKEHCENQKLDVFLASISLDSGERWTPQIKSALKASNWVFLLASKAALASPNVQMEVGGAIFSEKKLVPIMWDVEPQGLPRWIADYQGIILKGATMENINLQMSQLAAKVRSEKDKGTMVVGAVFFGLLYLLTK